MSNTVLQQRLRPGTPVGDGQISETEARLGHAYPPSFRALLLEHGTFALIGPSSEAATFEAWPLAEHKTALERAAEELECDATAAEVGEQLGLPAKTLAALAQIILVGSEGHTDFVGFDLRTRDDQTGEASFVLQLMDDLEIEHLAAHPGNDNARGFEAWLEKHASRRS
jgi:hypothetical protein